jgi:hypothetical protein
MYCKRFVRVLPVFALTASLGYAALVVEPDLSILFGGSKIELVNASGGWPTHRVIQGFFDENHPLKHQKKVGKPKFEDITVSMRVGQFDPIMLDYLNASLKGVKKSTDFSILLSKGKKNEVRYNFFEAWPTRIVTPGFDSDAGDCSDWEFSLRVGQTNGYPGMLKMKAKEKANRTKCANNMRLIVNEGGKPRIVDVTSCDPCETIVLEADLDGDGEYEPLGMNVGNVVLYAPASQAEYFHQWMRMGGENPLFEGKDATLRIQAEKFGLLEFSYTEMAPISVAPMADGSVRVEFKVSEEQLKANPRH